MTDSTDNAPKRIAHPYKGPDLPTEVFADPGRHDWYFREKMPDSVARFVRADLAPDPMADPRVAGLLEALNRVPKTYAIYGADRTDAYARGYCGGVEAFVKEIRAALAALSPTGGNADG